MNFTTDQQKIIDARNKNLLVSAAAGSGKTAVMVERIINLITDSENPVDIDRFLVVTFTRAAAAQMRSKISDRIYELLAEDPENAHLERQSSLIHNAQITTIDAFCLYILKNNFSDSDVEPGFRIADEGEMKLLKKDVLDEVIEQYYVSGDEDFLHMADSLSTGNEDTPIEGLILGLYETAMSDPWPIEWLKCHAQDYYVNENNDDPSAMDPQLYKCLVDIIVRKLKCMRAQLEEAKRISLLPDGPYMYEDAFLQDICEIGDIIGRIDAEDADYDTLKAIVSSFSFTKPARCTDKSVDPDKKKRAVECREAAKKILTDLTSNYLGKDSNGNILQMARCDRVLEKLCQVTVSFKEALDAEMKERGILSFGDCEHKALDIMVMKDPDSEKGWRRTEAAAEYSRYFNYVFVDEYQDSNLIQELLLSAVSGENDGVYNRFMVGDVKQSIYRFRQARPEIFMAKYDEYSDASDEKMLVDLHQNFRSRTQVLNTANDIFARIMSKETGGVDYDEKTALHPGADFPDPEGINVQPGDTAEYGNMQSGSQTEDDTADEYTSEFNIYVPDVKNKDSKIETEARGVAVKIGELMRTLKVRCEDDKTQKRPLRYGDIVILFRVPSAYGDIFRRVFEEMGIPVHVTGTKGYFSTYEIRTLMQLLRIIVNPLQDISFYGVMDSFIGGFLPDEIASIRSIFLQSLPEGTKTGDGYLCDACRYVASEAEDEALKSKTAAFMTMLESFREMSEYLTVQELLWKILEVTDYRAHVRALKGGKKRLANVDMLCKKAADFTETSYFGLHNYIRYIDQYEKYELDDEESETVDENADVVRIMSIHKSKGLEFPVCFVSGLGRDFNMKDTAAPLLADSYLGLAIKDTDPVRRTRDKTLRSCIIADKIKRDEISEELRILYVALTRAEEKLILTASVSGLKKSLGKAVQDFDGVRIDPDIVGNTRGFFQMLCLCLAQAGCINDLIAMCRSEDAQTDNIIPGTADDTKLRGALYVPELHMNMSVMDEKDLCIERMTETIDMDLRRKQFDAELMDERISAPEYREYLEKLFSSVYPFENLRGIYTKASVSELKAAAMPEDAEAAFELINSGGQAETGEYVPAFISGEHSLPGSTVRGSAFHRGMELMDFVSLHNSADKRKNISEQLDGFNASGLMSSEQRDILRGKEEVRILAFAESRLAGRMAEAQKRKTLRREEPFMMGISADLVNPEYPGTETVLIQGIIDVFWEEDDGYVILDYKTDRVSQAGRLKELYSTQLEYYEKALNSMNMHVKEKLIYSFALNETIVL